MWKIPGGLVDDGEYLSQAVEREVNIELRMCLKVGRFGKKRE